MFGYNGALHLMAEDALGTVRGFVNDNAAGAVTDTFGAFAFGAPRTRTGSDAFSLAWGGGDGYQTDANGLVLMGNRVYHVYTGRFLTRDPAGAGDNDYEYADDSPLDKIDPSGLSPATLNGGFGGVLGGDFGSWFGGDSFVSIYGLTSGFNQFKQTVTSSTDYYLNFWQKDASDKLWTCLSSTYLFTFQSVVTYDELFPTSGVGVTNYRIPRKTVPPRWPIPPVSLVGKKAKWNQEGYIQGKVNVTWDDKSHGAGVRGNDGHWDQDMGGGGTQGCRWDRNGNLLSSPYNALDLSQYDWSLSGNFSGGSSGASGAFGASAESALAL